MVVLLVAVLAVLVQVSTVVLVLCRLSSEQYQFYAG